MPLALPSACLGVVSRFTFRGILRISVSRTTSASFGCVRLRRCWTPTSLPTAYFLRAFVSSSFSCCSPMEEQFASFHNHLEASRNLQERIRAVTVEIESANRLIQSTVLLIHQSSNIPEVLSKADAQLGKLKDLYSRLAAILREWPGEYYRFHGEWRTETQTVVSLIAFINWLEKGDLLSHAEAQEKLGLNAQEFGLDVEDYLIGLCFMSNELPRYVVNRVTSGDYDSPRRVMKFLTDLHTAFRMLNLRNDFLRKKFDGMKYDLRRVEEVYYDVRIRGLAAREKADDPSKGS